MQSTCATCGKPFEALRSTKKFCSSGCRVRAHRAPHGADAAAVAEAPAPAAPAPPPPVAGGLVAATEHELQAAGRMDSANGQAALALARMIDSPGTDTGSAVAALVREHRAALTAAVANVEKAADPVDELTKRRNQRRTGTAPEL